MGIGDNTQEQIDQKREFITPILPKMRQIAELKQHHYQVRDQEE